MCKWFVYIVYKTTSLSGHLYRGDFTSYEILQAPPLNRSCQHFNDITKLVVQSMTFEF